VDGVLSLAEEKKQGSLNLIQQQDALKKIEADKKKQQQLPPQKSAWGSKNTSYAKGEQEDSGFFDYDDDEEATPTKPQKQPTPQKQPQQQPQQSPKQQTPQKLPQQQPQQSPKQQSPQQPLPKKQINQPVQNKPQQPQQATKTKGKKNKGRSMDASELGFTSNIDTSNVVKIGDNI
jgi:outer membrane biosynthesis protein TonB